MGYYDDWISKNPGKGGLLANAEFVLRKMDSLSAPPHTHDDRYYTESEVDTKLAGHTHKKSDITDFPSLISINTIYPVGSIYLSVASTNPETWLPGTTWSVWGTGRVPVGVDTSNGSFNAIEKTGGETAHTLTTAEMPQHNHSANGWGGESGNLESGSLKRSAMKNDEASNLATTNTGSSQAHNNLQPYITCYMFKRIA
jgi:hypothetical protein